MQQIRNQSLRLVKPLSDRQRSHRAASVLGKRELQFEGRHTIGQGTDLLENRGWDDRAVVVMDSSYSRLRS